MSILSPLDWIAVSWFVLAWAGYSIMIELTPLGRRSLNARMHRHREGWMRQMLGREMRMVDGQIMGSLQNGTAFFASTSLLAIGGSLALLRAAPDISQMYAALPLGIQPSPGLLEIKIGGLLVIFIYAFFKFAWSYGCSIMPRSCSARRRPPATKTSAAPRPQSSASPAWSRSPAATSIAASAPSSSRSAISAGSSTAGC